MPAAESEAALWATWCAATPWAVPWPWTSRQNLRCSIPKEAGTESFRSNYQSGFGGLGGHLVRYVALGNVKHFRERLDETVDVVGCGGVATGEDAFAHILCGATAVQGATQHRVEGAGCFQRIADELVEVMRRTEALEQGRICCRKGYRCLGDFRGKLRLRGRL